MNSFDGAVADYIPVLEDRVEPSDTECASYKPTVQFSKPTNPVDVYNLVQETCADSEEARAVINLYHSRAFMYNAERASLMEKKLGNMNLPSPEIRKADASWIYDKAMKSYDTAIQAHAGDPDNEDFLKTEKSLFKTKYGDLDKLVREGISTKLPHGVREMEFPTYLN